MTIVVLLSKSAVENPLCIAVVGMAKLLNVAVFEFIVCDFFCYTIEQENVAWGEISL